MLVFQDMAFTERLYPMASEFVANVRAEVREQVLRLRSHASVAVYDTIN